MFSCPPNFSNNGSDSAAIECSASSPGDPAEIRILATLDFYEPADYSRGLCFTPLDYAVERWQRLTLALENVRKTLLLGIFLDAAEANGRKSV